MTSRDFGQINHIFGSVMAQIWRLGHLRRFDAKKSIWPGDLVSRFTTLRLDVGTRERK